MTNDIEYWNIGRRKPSEDDEYMCPNCVTPWKCNGPHIPEEVLFWCEVCQKNDDVPHTPIDHPWLLKGHRLIPKPKVERHPKVLAAIKAEAVAAERARIKAAVEAAFDKANEGLEQNEEWCLSRAAVLAIIDREDTDAHD